MASVHVGSVILIALRAARCVIRTSTERPEALDRACFALAGIDGRGLLNAVRTAVALDAEGPLPQAPVPDYADENVSTKVVKSIQSYTGIVDKMVWRKR